jgi:23S rRNA C2498 (ribose-2'-O)-methylase RlmM
MDAYHRMQLPPTMASWLIKAWCREDILSFRLALIQVSVRDYIGVFQPGARLE